MERSEVKRHIEVDDIMDDNESLAHSRGKYLRTEKDEIGESKDYESKHTLDSDEEDDVKYGKLNMDEVEGQEETGEEYEGNMKITAFNVKEDLEEGHFDAAGNFIFDKSENEIKDAWLDNIDWASVKAKAGVQWHSKNEEDGSTTKSMGDMELKGVYEKVLTFLHPGETVERALHKLGREKGLSIAEERKRRWAAKKAGVEYKNERESAMKELTGLVDSLVSNGQLEAYQYSYEKFKHFVSELESKAVDQLDMFSETTLTASKGVMLSEKDVLTEQSSVEPPVNNVTWEYKLTNEVDAKIMGPVSSEEMLRLQASGKFDDGGWARKFGTHAFYSIARLDFEIYT